MRLTSFDVFVSRGFSQHFKPDFFISRNPCQYCISLILNNFRRKNIWQEVVHPYLCRPFSKTDSSLKIVSSTVRQM